MATKVGDAYVEMSARDTQLSRDLAGAQSKVEKAARSMEMKLGNIGKGMTVAGAAITAAVTKAFLDFTKYETKLIDMAKVTDEPFDRIEKKLKTLDPILGSSTELMAGYYQVISAGVKDPIEALELLRVAAETGKAAHVEQSEVVKGITKMMSGYEGAIEDAAEAADLLFAIEKEGQTAVAELIPYIGGLAKISFDLNIEQEAMAASLAVITKTAGGTSEAVTQYEAILVGLMKPTTDMEEAITAMGYETAELAIKEEGLVEVLKFLEEHMESTGVSAAKLFGRKEAMIGFSALGAKGFKTLDDTIVEVGKSAGGAQKAFDDWSEGGSAAITEIKNVFLNFSADVGKQLAPMIKELIGTVTEVIKKMADWAAENPKLFETIVKVGAVIGGLAVVGGPILMAVSALGLISGAIGLLLSPIGLVIAAVAALALAWATNFGGIRDITKSVFEFVKGAFDKLVKFISASFERLKKIIDYIKKVVAGIGLGEEYVYAGARGARTPITVQPYAGPTTSFHQAGIPYIPKKGFYGLDVGEKVLTAKESITYNQQRSYASSINIQPGAINIITPKFGSADGQELFRQLEIQIKMRGLKLVRT